MDNTEIILNILFRACLMDLCDFGGNEFNKRMKDVQYAYEKFNLDLESWLMSDDLTFKNEFLGIINNIKRGRKVSTTSFGDFTPKFVNKKSMFTVINGSKR